MTIDLYRLIAILYVGIRAIYIVHISLRLIIFHRANHDGHNIFNRTSITSKTSFHPLLSTFDWFTRTHKLSAKFTNRRSFWHQPPLIIERSDGGTQRGKVDGELCPFPTFTRTKSNHHCTSSSPQSTPITPRGIRTCRTANTDDKSNDSNYDSNDYDPQDDPQDRPNARTFFWRRRRNSRD